MKILLIHQNFPGQYRHLAPALVKEGHSVIGLGETSNLQEQVDSPGLLRLGYKTPQAGGRDTHHYIRSFEGHIRRGQQVVRSLLNLQEKIGLPDLILAHPGWGESLYVKDVFPTVPLIGLFEFYYRGRGQDVGFDPEFTADSNLALDSLCRIRTKNVNNLLALEAVDAGICPTHYQKSVMPEIFQHKLRVIHDGIDTTVACPNPEASLTLQIDGQPLTLDRQTEVITFVNRNLEPYRGYHIFMRCLPRLLQERPHSQVVIIGGDSVSYGAPPPSGNSWKQIFLDPVHDQLDMSRVHMPGKVPYSQLITLFQVSSVHVYLTYPFVLSWSMLEAMSCGCVVVGSKTAPVQEVIQEGKNGFLVDFFSPDEIVNRIHDVLNHPTQMQPIRDAARQTIVETYDLQQICLPQHLAFIQSFLDA